MIWEIFFSIALYKAGRVHRPVGSVLEFKMSPKISDADQ